MPRDPDSLRIQKWAADGDVATPESVGLVRATGWPASYSQRNGDLPKREVMNQLFREPTALGVELNTRGLLEWNTAIDYTHPAMVMGSDAKLYVSVADSTGVDPTTNTTQTYWVPLEQLGPKSDVTFEALNANGDVGSGSGQVAAGNHSHTPQVQQLTEQTSPSVNRDAVDDSSNVWTTVDTFSVSADPNARFVGLFEGITFAHGSTSFPYRNWSAVYRLLVNGTVVATTGTVMSTRTQGNRTGATINVELDEGSNSFVVEGRATQSRVSGSSYRGNHQTYVNGYEVFI